MIGLSSTDGLLSAMRNAKSIAFTAYTLPQGRVLDGLIAAAERGVKVRVRLEGWIYKGDQDNLAVIKRLSSVGADAQLEHTQQKDGRRLLHMKSAIVDDALFLDDRNWPDDDRDTIVRDDFRQDIAAVRAADETIVKKEGSIFSVYKRDSLFNEAKLLWAARRGDNVIVETEAFGNGNVAYRALAAASRAGAHVRVLVSARDLENNSSERRAIAKLAGPNIEFRACDGDEKFAIVNGGRGWVGSSNLSGAFDHPDQIDWGLRTDDAQILAHASYAFDQRWKSSRALASVSESTSSMERPKISATLSRVNAT
jgi:hypothetical protein